MGLIKKEGYLVKSPPKDKMQNSSSWCTRYFVLAEIGYNDKIQQQQKQNKFHSNFYNKNNNNYNSDHDSVHTTPKASTEIYLIYWKDLHYKKKGKKPKGKNIISCRFFK